MSEQQMDVVVEYRFRSWRGEFWLDVRVDRALYTCLGPYETERERELVLADLLDMMNKLGGAPMPGHMQ